MDKETQAEFEEFKKGILQELDKRGEEFKDVAELQKEIELRMVELEYLQKAHRNLTGRRHVMPCYTETPEHLKIKGDKNQ